MLKEQFESILKNFGDLYFEDLELDEETNTATITMDEDVLINITYLDDSENVLIFSPLAEFTKDEDKAQEKALSLMRLNDIDNIAGNCTYMFDEQNSLLLVGDRRSSLLLSTVDDFAAWIKLLLDCVHKTREYFVANYPQEGE
jgi:hypothetical protein